MQKAPDDQYLTAPMVQERYKISDVSLHRWLRNPKMSFPQATYIGRRRFFLLRDLEAWERGLSRETRKAVSEGDEAA